VFWSCVFEKFELSFWPVGPGRGGAAGRVLKVMIASAVNRFWDKEFHVYGSVHLLSLRIHGPSVTGQPWHDLEILKKITVILARSEESSTRNGEECLWGIFSCLIALTWKWSGVVSLADLVLSCQFIQLLHKRDPLQKLKLHLGEFTYKDAEAVNTAGDEEGDMGTNIAVKWNVHL
jgi:hypothetical protein